MAKKILVLGSSNIDFILQIPRFHHPGETITAKNLVTAFGGKGANQVIASKRLGGDVTLVTKFGNDHYGKSYRRYLAENRLRPDTLLEDRKNPTGMAVIELTPNGENRIIVSPGANSSLSVNDLKRLSRYWRGVDIFVTQLEIPIPTVKIGLKMAKEQDALTLLNPSPPVPLPSNTLSLIDFIVPNELEAQLLTGIKWKEDIDIRRIAKRLLEMGPKNVVITLGSKGLFFKNEFEEIRMEAFKVKVVDTTAAGDAFMGALACGLSQGKSIREVLKFANTAGALATTKMGAQPSLPQRGELDIFLKGVERVKKKNS
ncbi:MAG: ribokinase [Deltaproteobacteria bacterium RBG_19FT_COMBO_46_12]|nr:MAG: ribokinase [Deltaproteobacteria bacterium RBG_19FT_COMBO_46_12]